MNAKFVSFSVVVGTFFGRGRQSSCKGNVFAQTFHKHVIVDAFGLKWINKGIFDQTCKRWNLTIIKLFPYTYHKLKLCYKQCFSLLLTGKA